jgi:hypothetical protein
MSKEQELTSKPAVSSGLAQKELDKVEKQFEKFNEQISSLTVDRMNAAPKEETEPQTKLSQKEISKSPEIYLKPKRTIGSKEKFNEAHREDYNFAKELVYFIAENKESIGDPITLWTKKFPGLPAEEWVVPTNKPVWGPRYLADRIKECSYHVLTMEETKVVNSDQMGSYTGHMVVDSIRQRLDAHPASQRKSIFMGASGF